MKTIKIFLASSEELENDRNAFGNLVRKLNRTYNKRGINLELFEWEDYDAAYNDKRKQDEYNENVRASDMFLAVFHRVAGRFTIEEFDVATEEFRKKASPKVYVYCKNIEKGESESLELKEFKQRLIDEMGHYWSRYANKDTMHLHFVMQLQMVESSTDESLKVEDGVVVLDGQPIARMENLPFASQNEDFKRISAHLAELPRKIEKKRLKVEKDPDDEDYRSELQQLLNEYNSLKETFAKWQNDLFATAKRVARLQGERVTERMRRAMEAFNEGKIQEANIILDEAEQDGKIALHEFEQCKELMEEKRNNVIASIEEILLKISTIQSDLSISPDDRNKKVEELYEQVILMAQKVEYEPRKYAEILFNFAIFLDDTAQYSKALEFHFKAVNIIEKVLGKEHPDTASSYNNIGIVYDRQGDYPKALEYYFKALNIREKVLGKEHPDTASSYNCIGLVYDSQGDYPKALEFHFKALDIYEKVLGKEHPDTASSYNNIGIVYDRQGDYPKALEYFFKALNIREKVLGKEHPDTASSYNSIGLVYDSQGDYPKALEFHFKALDIFEKVLGKEHPNTADSYNNIGLVYCRQGDYPKGLEYFFKALNIREKVLGKEHPDTASSYNNIGLVYDSQGDYPKALEFHFKALNIREKDLGKEHPDTASSYNNIGTFYYNQGDYPKALEYYFKALNIREKVLGKEHPNTADSYNNIGVVYDNQGDYPKVLEFHFKALDIYEKVLGKEHPDTASSYNNIGSVYDNQGDYPKALEYYFKALNIREKVLGEEYPDTIKLINRINAIQKLCSEEPKGLLHNLKGLFRKLGNVAKNSW